MVSIMPTHFNTLENLLTKDQYETYVQTAYPFRITIVADALRERIERDKDYEVFLPFFYHKHSVLMRQRDGFTLLTPYKVFISNRGNVCSLRGDEPVFIEHGISNGYLTIKLPDRNLSVVLHRALACSFVPLPAALGGHHPKDLQVNHIDGDKLNFELVNLEWCTSQGNIQHAFDTGLMFNASGIENQLSIPVKGTVLEGDFSGTEFILVGAKQCKDFGFDQSMIGKCCVGKKPSHKNCSWVYATPEEIANLPTGISKEVRDSIAFIKKPKKVFKSNIRSTNLETGESFIIEGGAPELRSLGFTPSGVSNVLSGRNPKHKNHTFERI